MTRLVFAAEGRVCVRFFRRADALFMRWRRAPRHVLTEDCPMGVALALKRAKRRHRCRVPVGGDRGAVVARVFGAGLSLDGSRATACAILDALGIILEHAPRPPATADPHRHHESIDDVDDDYFTDDGSIIDHDPPADPWYPA